MKIKSYFAVLDVVGPSRKKLEKHFGGESLVDKSFYIPIVLRGWIVGQHGNDDGTSIEFTVDVGSVVVGVE